MMFQLFEVIADRVREQAADYADAQARIGRRTVTDTFDPFGLTTTMTEPLPIATPAIGTALRPPRPKSAGGARRKARPAVKRRSRRSRRPALNVA